MSDPQQPMSDPPLPSESGAPTPGNVAPGGVTSEPAGASPSPANVYAPPPPVLPNQGFTLRAVGFGLAVLTLWVFLLNTMYPDNSFRLQQIILLMGFGALLTMFLTKAVFDYLPESWQLLSAEKAVFYTILLIGIPSAMLGRLALESAAVNHMGEVGGSAAGESGFVPPHWAPQGHVQLPAHWTPMDAAAAEHSSGAATLSLQELLTQTRQAETATQALYQTVLLEYLFAQNPTMAESWAAVRAAVVKSETPEFHKLDDFSGSLYRACLTNPTAAPPEFTGFRADFDREKSEAVEIFKPLAAVADDARRYANYVEDLVRHPPAGDATAAAQEAYRQKILRGLGATESCRTALAVAQQDILARLEELHAGYLAIRGVREGRTGAGKAGVPWKLWIGPMLFWGAVMAAFHGLAFAFLLAMRKVWVETERLPFPYTIFPERLDRGLPGLSGPDGETRQPLFPSKWLYLPFLIGVGLCLPAILGLSAQAINPPPPNPLDNVRDLSVEGWDIKLNVDTWTLALILLFPLDLIFSTLFFFFIGAYAIPYLVRLFGVEGFGQNLIPYQMLRMGGFLGLFLGTVWFNRSTMWQLVSGRRPGPAPGVAVPPETDPLRPWAVTAVFWISLIALCGLLLSGLPGITFKTLALCLFGLFVVIVYNFQEWRIRAEGGMVAWDFNNIMKVQTWSNWYVFGLHHSNPDKATQLPMAPQPAAWQQLYHTSMLGTYVPTLGPGAYFLEAFRIGDLFRAGPRAILKAALLAFGLALVVGMPVYLWGIYDFGLKAQPLSDVWFNFAHSSDKVFKYYMKKSDGGPFGTATGDGWTFFYNILLGANWKNTFLWTVAGAAVVIVLMHLRRNKPRFPLHPVGFVLAGLGGSNTQMETSSLWFAWLLALTLKWVLHDWFGVRVFRSKVEPTLVYLILGLLAGILVYMVLVVIRLRFGVTWWERVI